MQISVNGQICDVGAATLGLLLMELGYETETVATSLNQEFIRGKDRPRTLLRDGDAVEIVTPRQGG